MSPDEKSSLIYELMYFASNNARVLNADSPKVEIFHICKGIISGISRTVSNRQILIQELKKHKELWDKVKPFLYNESNKCTTDISPALATNRELCNHHLSLHVNGKCYGQKYKFVDEKLCWVLCPCKSLKYTIKW